ncbi:lysophospholipid acyltransferase family protein [Enemella sp. A6]|uniref:lysophospholipid acyltransferase family protein n=1 Tax=Enemella sp. A6 TaxID=3440152 RepID=UPI003EB7BC81
MKFRPNDRVYRLIVRCGQLLIRLFRVPMRVTGVENLPPVTVRRGRHVVQPGRGAVVAINHFGLVDFVFAEAALFRYTRAHSRFMITKKRASGAFMEAICQLCNHVVVDRSRGDAAYREAVAKLRDGEYLALFAEGSTNLSFQLRPLKTGSVRMAAETGAPIIPVSVFGAHRILTRGRRASFRSAWRTPVHVHFSEPITVSPDEDVRVASERLREALQAGIDRGIAEYPEPLPAGAWWVPAALGGGARTVEEELEVYHQERSRYGETG